MQISSKFTRLTKRAGFQQLIPALLIAAAIIITFATVTFAADLRLIDAATLQSNPAKWIILDARPKADWEAGHIPGAINFSWDSYTRTDARGVKYSTFPPHELASALAGLGIDENSPLVVYGDADKSWGGEGYAAWLFSWLGHKGPIRLLNGGIQSWQARNLPQTKGAEKPAAKKDRYQTDLNPRIIVSSEEIRNSKGSFTLVDVRSNFEWLKGSIPGAVHIPWEDFYTGKDRRPLAAAELKKLLAKNGVDPAKPIVYYCLGGVRSAYAWTAHQLAGLPQARNYKGSWADWEKRSGQ